MTNISARSLDKFYDRHPGQKICVWVKNTPIPGLLKTYCRTQEGSMLALIGSRGYLEISANCASAAEQLKIRKGDSVSVRPLKGENESDML
jgi:hypothetical protein